MGTQDNVSQSKEMVRQCMNTGKPLCTQGIDGVDTILYDWLKLSPLHIGFRLLTQNFLL